MWTEDQIRSTRYLERKMVLKWPYWLVDLQPVSLSPMPMLRDVSTHHLVWIMSCMMQSLIIAFWNSTIYLRRECGRTLCLWALRIWKDIYCKILFYVFDTYPYFSLYKMSSRINKTILMTYRTTLSTSSVEYFVNGYIMFEIIWWWKTLFIYVGQVFGPDAPDTPDAWFKHAKPHALWVRT